jgi:peptidoglycan/xylan/chitin deacetylase (PgdA/CDA1 family)
MRNVGFRRWLVLAGLLGLAGCSDQIQPGAGPADPGQALPGESKSIPKPHFSTVYNSAPVLALCGAEDRYTLLAGKFIQGARRIQGTIRVGNDAANLYVTYASEGDEWYLTDTRVAVGRSLSSIPVDAEGKVDPWNFPYTATHDPSVQAYTYSIPLSSINARAGDKLVVAAWAGSVHPVAPADWEGPWEWVTGWGLGDLSAATVANLSTYTVASCPNQPPPPPRTTGAITITFDDGWLTTYQNAYPVMKEFGLKANMALYTDAISQNWDYFMTPAMVRELYTNEGWTVVSHTLTHPRLDTLSATELDRQLRESQIWIQQQGYTRGAHIFVVPFHSWGAREQAAVKKYYRASRGYSANQFQPERMVDYPVTDPYNITAFEPEFAPYTTVQGRAATRGYLDRAVQDGKVIDIFFHQIPTENIPAFREMVKILAEYKPYIKTYDQIVP